MTGPASEAGGEPAKQDPETLILRGRPQPVVRFRRGLIIGVTGATAGLIVAVTWLALEPPSFRGATEQQVSGLARAAPPEALAGTPSNYGEVPQLGPPLPGDLGRPVLEYRRQQEAIGAPDQFAQPGGDHEVARGVEAARQRESAARETARASGLLVRLREAGNGTAPSAGVEAPDGEQGRGAAPPPVAELRPRAEAAANQLNPTPMPWTISAGSIISASLLTGLNSDQPGLVLAQITEPVRDSLTGTTVLIPQGSRLIGRYGSDIGYGQRRALLVWQRLVLPDGSSIGLGDVPATDLAGQAGLEDRVDFHTGRLLKGIFLSTLLGLGTEVSIGSEQSQIARAIRESAKTGSASAADEITKRNLEVEPTLRVRPGWPVRAILHQDLTLTPWRG